MDVGNNLYQLGRSDEAELMGREVLVQRPQKLGPDHPHTLVAMENLANSVREQAQRYQADSSEKEAPSLHSSRSMSPSLVLASPR
ncbi:hypothetical protein BDV98DRAFT_517849 [Pterulicium gracile]|uniref:Kinesin light chain n=1 Tax=Pterulicium gracile TaxID=1884261 RepID=A0A5C3Q064_9AGAR|nr:hypothetical protein BDV98DRAFT_517849 [Pterula gracilis]